MACVKPQIALDLRKPPDEHARMVVASAKTADGRFVVYVHEHQRAELCEVYGVSRLTIFGPGPLYKVTDRLVALGYGEDYLRPE